MMLTLVLYGVSPALAATAPTLGTAQSYGILGGTTVTNTGPTVVNGDLGVSPGAAVTGFPPGIVTETIHAADAAALQAQNDVTTAYNNLAGQTCDFGPFGPTDLAGQTLVPGVYCFSSSVENTGVLTLNAGGDPNAVWVFKMGSTLITGPDSSVVVINGGQDCNVFWQVGSSATLDTTTNFVGNILALTSITLNTGADISGRALARNGAVTMDTNVITPTICRVTKALQLTKTASPVTYDHVGQTITYAYEIKNTGDVALTGPFTVSDDKAVVTCPQTPISLDPGASIICSASYIVTQDDLDAGSITNTATAKADNNGNYVTDQKQVTITRQGAPIPEFSTILLPVISVIGLMLLLQRRKSE